MIYMYIPDGHGSQLWEMVKDLYFFENAFLFFGHADIKCTIGTATLFSSQMLPLLFTYLYGYIEI